MNKHGRPTIVVSKCLEFAHCRYNGDVIPSKLVRMLMEYADFKPVCPEFEIGLGVPRDPIRIIEDAGTLRLFQPATGRDVSGEMTSFSESFLGSLTGIDGFILKSKSPSCGLKDVKVHSAKNGRVVSQAASGFFAEAVANKFSGIPVESEGRLSNYEIREDFLTKLYMLAEFRDVKPSGRISRLVDFQSRHKLLLMGYSQKEMRILGNIVANHNNASFDDIIHDYERHLRTAIIKMPRRGSVVNVLLHAFGYFKNGLSTREKAYFLDVLDDYRNRRIPLSSVQLVLKSWIIRFESDYLINQSFFDPFPEQLIEVSDSGKGRKL